MSTILDHKDARVAVVGSRGVTDYALVKSAIEESGFCPRVILSGRARGVDKLGERWARENGVSVDFFPAQWQTFGRSAGVIRNRAMIATADAVVAVWDGVSPGTKHSIAFARRSGLPIFIKRSLS